MADTFKELRDKIDSSFEKLSGKLEQSQQELRSKIDKNVDELSDANKETATAVASVEKDVATITATISSVKTIGIVATIACAILGSVCRCDKVVGVGRLVVASQSSQEVRPRHRVGHVDCPMVSALCACC